MRSDGARSIAPARVAANFSELVRDARACDRARVVRAGRISGWDRNLLVLKSGPEPTGDGTEWITIVPRPGTHHVAAWITILPSGESVSECR
jgi:hypothetical protein